MRWTHLDADGEPIVANRKYLFNGEFVGMDEDLKGMVRWTRRYGYIFKPDDKNLSIFSIPFQQKPDRVLIYSHIRREKRNGPG